jgi:hypothetical protein
MSLSNETLGWFLFGLGALFEICGIHLIFLAAYRKRISYVGLGLCLIGIAVVLMLQGLPLTLHHW